MRVPSPMAKNNPHMASVAVASQAKSLGARSNGKPNFETSLGNQSANLKQAQFL